MFVDPNTTKSASGISATKVLDVPISTINMAVAVKTIMQWVETRTAHYVCVRDVHGIMRAQEDADLKRIHDNAGLVTPDGMPLVWLCRWRGYGEVSRVCGADLVEALSAASVKSGARHYFYGGKPGVAERMAARLQELHPGLQIAGCSSPPFRSLDATEDAAITKEIASSKPDIVWVGLSTPKQEFWMRDHIGKIPGATLMGVGAAFDFYAGDVKRAPAWMHHSGLEWAHRLFSEPTRLWRRYLVLAPQFVLQVVRRGLGRGV